MKVINIRLSFNRYFAEYIWNFMKQLSFVLLFPSLNSLPFIIRFSVTKRIIFLVHHSISHVLHHQECFGHAHALEHGQEASIFSCKVVTTGAGYYPLEIK
jgi:hypothetical protein